jgi:hypothetical protein
MICGNIPASVLQAMEERSNTYIYLQTLIQIANIHWVSFVYGVHSRHASFLLII